jgi:hypothetical protein
MIVGYQIKRTTKKVVMRRLLKGNSVSASELTVLGSFKDSGTSLKEE